MTCREMAEFLADYVAGDLPHEIHVEFEAHTARCGDCVAYLAQYRTTIVAGNSAFGDRPADPFPEDLIAAVLAALAKGDART
jgi:anti-sigma factor RsiW